MKTSIAKSFLHFTRSERGGIALFALLSFLIFWLPSLFPHWAPRESADFSAFQEEIIAFQSKQPDFAFVENTQASGDTIDPNQATVADFIAIGLAERIARTIVKYREKGGRFRYKEDLQKIYSIDEETYAKIEAYLKLPEKTLRPQEKKLLSNRSVKMQLAAFDPNTASREELIQLGFPDRTAGTLINFRSKGGTFRYKEDLRKVYGLSETLYGKLAPYIELEEKNAPIAIGKESIKIDINRADAEDWRRLRGIGPVLSSRIVKFREKLGGFISVEQVAETYGLADSTFQQIKPQLIASPLSDSLRINQLTVEELQAHPYLNWRQAKAIINYRMQHGPFKNLEDFAKIKVLPEDKSAKLGAYLSFE